MLYHDSDNSDNFLSNAKAEESGCNREALGHLIEEAERTQTHGLLIIKDNTVLVERYFNHEQSPIELMSITKSVASLSLGFLLAENKISSLDMPVSTWFQEWKEGIKSRVTLRHILTHTSGIEHEMDALKLSRQKDQLNYVRRLGVVSEPGKVFAYNNEATQLLSGVIQTVAGISVDEYLKNNLFEPLGIGSSRWQKDQAGNILMYSGLSMTAQDLARIGLLMLREGAWRERRMLPASYINSATTSSVPAAPFMGFFWWIRGEEIKFRQSFSKLEDLKNKGFSAAAKLKSLSHDSFYRLEEYWMEVGALLPQNDRKEMMTHLNQGIYPTEKYVSRTKGYYADGWLGQRLMVYPGWNLVAVRLHKQLAEGGEKEHQQAGFPQFVEALEACMTHPI